MVEKRKVIVTNPLGDKTVNYFSQPLNVHTAPDWTDGTTVCPSTGARFPEPFLSHRDLQGFRRLKRSIYLAYEHDRLPQEVTGNPEDWYNTNRRVITR